MAGKLFDLVKRDSRHHITKGGFHESIIISTITGDITLNITGFATKHHFGIDLDGNAVNTTNYSISKTRIITVYIKRNA